MDRSKPAQQRIGNADKGQVCSCIKGRRGRLLSLGGLSLTNSFSSAVSYVPVLAFKASKCSFSA